MVGGLGFLKAKKCGNIWQGGSRDELCIELGSLCQGCDTKRRGLSEPQRSRAEEA